MKPLIRRARETTLIRYLIVGGGSYAVELSSLLAIYHFAHTSKATATAIAYWIGLALAFGLQKLVAFQNYEKQASALSRQGVLYGLLQAWDYIFTVAFVGLLGGNVIITRTIAQVLFSTWNYILYRKVIFKKSTELAV